MTALLKITYKAGALLMAACAGLIVCSSCTDEEFMKGSGKTDKLSFGVSISDKWNAGPTTRSTENNGPKYEAYKFDNSDMWIIEENGPWTDETAPADGISPLTRAKEITTDNFYTSFGVYAYVQDVDDSETWNQSTAKLYIDNDETEKSGDLWVNTPLRFWPGNQYKMKFFAYAPYSTTRITSKAGNSLTLTYDASEQTDLLVEEKEANGNYNHVLDLNFKHILTAIRIRAQEGLKGTVTKIEISGVKGGAATYNVVNGTWNEPNDKNVTFTVDNLDIDLSKTTSEEAEYKYVDIVTGNNTLLMIPQDLTGNAILTVYIDGKPHSGKIGIDKEGNVKTWQKGHRVTYTIKVTGEVEDDIMFQVLAKKSTDTDAPDNWKSVLKFENQNPGSFDLKIISHDKDNEGIAWKLERIEGDIDMLGKINGWQQWWTNNNYYITGNGDDDTRKKLPITSFDGNDHSENSELDVVSTDIFETKPIDLSLPLPRGFYNDLSGNPNHTDKRQKNYTPSSVNTANCYITYGRGEYAFPLVYGNAIKAGENNIPDNEKYYDYRGQEIISPYIQDAVKAIVIWENRENLIEIQTDGINYGDKIFSNRDYPKDKRYLKFRLRTEEIHLPDSYAQGNAIIGVVDKDNQLIWSWHIWMCGYRIGHDVTLQRGNYEFLPYDLGYCGAITKSRECKLHFVQTAEPFQTATLTLRQGNENDISTKASVLYYQWGRKDPFEHGNQLYRNLTPDNRTSEQTKYKGSPNQANYSVGIAPMIFYTYSPDWWNKFIVPNPWKSDKKNIYDPCPVGYKVPSVEALQYIKDELPEAGMCTDIDKNGKMTVTQGSYHWGAGYTSNYPEQYCGNINNLYPAYNGMSIRPMKE